MLQEKINYSLSEVFRACLSVLKKNDAEITEANEKKGLIEAKIGVTLLSWGNTITIHLNSKNNATELTIESSSNMIQISWGVNDEYENDLLDQIIKTLK